VRACVLCVCVHARACVRVCVCVYHVAKNLRLLSLSPSYQLDNAYQSANGATLSSISFIFSVLKTRVFSLLSKSISVKIKGWTRMKKGSNALVTMQAPGLDAYAYVCLCVCVYVYMFACTFSSYQASH